MMVAMTMELIMIVARTGGDGEDRDDGDNGGYDGGEDDNDWW